MNADDTAFMKGGSMEDQRSRIDYVGQFWCSPKERSILKRFGSETGVVVDWDLFMMMQELGFDLQPERDNKSVWHPRWIAKGLGAYGHQVPAALFERCSTTSEELGLDPKRVYTQVSRGSGPRESSNGAGPPFGGGTLQDHSRVRSSSTVGYGPAEDDGAVGRPLTGNRGEVLPDQRADNRGGDRGNGFDALVWKSAARATARYVRDRRRANPVLSLDEVARDHVHGSHFSGAPHFRRNKDALPAAIGRATDILAGTGKFLPYVAGRRVQHGELAPKGRLVWMAPLSTTLVGTMFAKAAYRSLKGVPVFAYGYWKQEIGAIASEFAARFKKVYCLDFSGFDSSLQPFVIDEAFGIVRSVIAILPEHEVVFHRLVNDFIHSRIILPDCSIWQKHRGVPSGSAFTSVVDSICNLLILNYVWIRLTGKALSDRQVMVLGDDSMIGSNSRLTLEQIAAVAAELGMTVNTLKSKVCNSETGVEFLGHTFKNSRAHRPPVEVAKREAFPERWRKRSHSDSLLRAYSYTADCEEALDITLKLFHQGGDVYETLIGLALAGKCDVIDITAVGQGRLRFMAMVDTESLPSRTLEEANLGMMGLKY